MNEVTKTRAELNEEKQKEIEREENYKKRKKIIIKITKILIISLIFFLSFFYYTTLISSKYIEIREERIIDNLIPNSFNSTKIIHFSDLHYGSTMNIEDEINLRNPDLVFFTGDLISKDYTLEIDEQEEVINQLQRINSTIGKYAVNGEEDKENYQTILNQSNFTLLSNSHELIYNNDNNPILLIGLDSSLTNNINIEQAYSYYNDSNTTPLYTITLLHEPDSIKDITKHTNLFLAGHSLGGEINIPYLGPLYTKENASIYTNSYYEENNYKIYINTGLGTNESSIRLFNRPTINFYRLSNQ